MPPAIRQDGGFGWFQPHSTTFYFLSFLDVQSISLVASCEKNMSKKNIAPICWCFWGYNFIFFDIFSSTELPCHLVPVVALSREQRPCHARRPRCCFKRRWLALVLRTETGETHLAFWKADFVGIVNCWELSQKVVRYFASLCNEIKRWFVWNCYRFGKESRLTGKWPRIIAQGDSAQKSFLYHLSTTIFNAFLFRPIHPWRLTWNIIMEVWKIIFLSKWVMAVGSSH